MDSSPLESTDDLEATRSDAKRQADEMLAILYEEMRRIARGQMRGQPANQTMQATALVNEAYLRIQSRREGAPNVSDRDRLLSLAAAAMRSVLVDNARAKNRLKRRPPGLAVPLDQVTESYEEHAIDLIALDEALDRLAEVDPQMVRIVELRFFGGLGLKEVARVLRLSVSRVENEWLTARAWLREELG